ncbi:MAG: carbohydrate kinase family protein [Chloroflexia bacterium]|nr:carbohydrate kinase family protein [Chloroflexia bacterium]
MIVVTGSIAFDYLMFFPGRFNEHILPDQLEKISLSFLVDDMRKVQGGCASNISYSLALLGERPCLMATIGHDGIEYRNWLALQGIDVSRLQICKDCFTASFFVSTDLDGNQIASFHAGAMSRARSLSFRHFPDPSEIEWAIISPNDPQAMANYAQECREMGIPFVYDPGQQVARVSGEELVRGLQGARILIANSYEYDLIRHKTGLDEGAILEQVGTLIVTQGAEGSTIITQEEGRRVTYEIPVAQALHVLDPTGVGDAFRAGLLKGLRVGLPWPVIGRLASLAAVYILEHPGPQPPPYTLEEFIQRYEQTFGPEPAIHAALLP